MEAFLVENLTAWIASLDGSEKLNFLGFRLECTVHTKSHSIAPSFPPCRGEALGRMCGLTAHDVRSLVCNGELDILGLIHRFSDAGDRSNHYWQGFRIRLIEVAQGLREGKSCIAMTLAETLMGLDALHRRETTRFAGSPLLLQHLVNALDERWWFDWMCNLSADRIAWRCPWLNLPAMSYSMSRLIGIQLVGLTHCVFYFPFRFLRQFGHDQICPPEGIEYPAAFPVRGAQLARYAIAWRTRELLAPAPTFSCTLSDECLDWLNEEAQVGPSLASEASTSSGRWRGDT
ncbi:hypothetical protein HYC85_028388 [Camellia sinensis]|uniref:Aminotransferase-like plant mobile domain-containing protein n=1 Tax=Camellia sinensis TaxID=4442 RepID=A0A7J7FVT6_CAMSI|nr:hypothetical protein HYC85_028388 [Camellia sinensis]